MKNGNENKPNAKTLNLDHGGFNSSGSKKSSFNYGEIIGIGDISATTNLKKTEQISQKYPRKKKISELTSIDEILAAMGRKKIEPNSPEYMKLLEEIAEIHDLAIKKHPEKGVFFGYCKVCGAQATTIFIGGKPVKALCEHQNEEYEREQIESKQQEINRYTEHLRSLSLLGDKFKNVCWANTKTGFKNNSFDQAYKRCFKYSLIPEEVQKEGLGIYLWGNKGVGKTRLTACIANTFISKRIPVLFTSLFEISKAIKATYKRNSIRTEQDLIEEFAKINFLVFDDIGSEIFTKNEADTWLQGLLFDLINKRYSNNRCTIFTSNYDLNELVSLRKIYEKTVDRITEMTSGAVMKIVGESNREKPKGKELPF